MGYIGNKRSERSLNAIENYEVPKSMINMKLINEMVEEEQVEQQVLPKVQLMTLKVFKEWIKPASWHHTGSFFNQTNHYDLVEELDRLNELSNEEIKQIKEEFKPSKKKDIKYGWVLQQIWGGTVKRPKVVGETYYFGEIKGDYLTDKEGVKHKLSANKTIDHKIFNTWQEAKKVSKKFTGNKTLKNDFVLS